MNVVVTGPESSGTRFVSRWLEAHDEIVARHWSMPSGEGWARHWPSDHDFGHETPHAVVFVSRSFEATVASQHHRELVSCRKEAEANIALAHLRAVGWAVAHGYPLYLLSYDEVIARPEAFDALFNWLGHDPVPCPEPIVDGNAKWRS